MIFPRNLILLLSLGAASACAQPLTATDNDMKTVYCAAVLSNRLKVMHTLEKETDPATPLGADIRRKHEVMRDNDRRITTYLRAKSDSLNWPVLLSAKHRADTDVASNGAGITACLDRCEGVGLATTEGRSCVKQCSTEGTVAQVAGARLRACDVIDWLPY